MSSLPGAGCRGAHLASANSKGAELSLNECAGCGCHTTSLCRCQGKLPAPDSTVAAPHWHRIQWEICHRAACREGYWGWSGVCSLDYVCRTIEPEALKQGNMSSLGFTSKEQRNLGLLVHLMTSNPKILYAPVGTEVDKVILKVRASAHEGAESRTLLLPLPLAQSTRDIHAQRSSGGLGGWS